MGYRMVPKFIELKNTEESITLPKSTGKVECCQCSEEYGIEEGFIILLTGDSEFRPICSHCAQQRFFGKIDYIDSYDVFIKRLRTFQFKDWKAKYNEKN